MKNKIRIFQILFLGLFLLSSCTPIAFLMYGVKNPKPVSHKYISKAIDKYQLSHFTNFTFDSKSDFISFFKQLKEFGLETSVNQVLIFNSQGFYYLPIDTSYCSGKVLDFVNHYKENSILVDTVSFNPLFMNSFRSIEDKKKYHFLKDSKKDLLVLTWASYAGRLNKINTKKWADSISKQVQENKIDAIFLNLDLQKDWE